MSAAMCAVGGGKRLKPKSRRLEKQVYNRSNLVVAVGGRKRWSSKSRQPKKKRAGNCSDLPRDVVECVIEHLNWADRIRMQAVCKAWSVPHLHIPTIDRVPWALTRFYWTGNATGGGFECMCSLIDPFSRLYPVEGGKKYRIFLNKRPRASVYGWVLFQLSLFSFYLYSPFTTEIIKLPKSAIYCPLSQGIEVATFSLNATSPKCTIFLLHQNSHKRKVCVQICSVGDWSWKFFEFNNDFVGNNEAADATYVNGVFYCVFSQGQLGAFDVELREWTILAAHLPPNHSSFFDASLVVSGLDLLLWNGSHTGSWQLFKFDFSDVRWVHVTSLNNHVLFIGCTSFCAPAVGEISELANTVFYCGGSVTCYGSTSPGINESLAYSKCAQAAKCAMTWIQLPSGSNWRAKDLINAV